MPDVSRADDASSGAPWEDDDDEAGFGGESVLDAFDQYIPAEEIGELDDLLDQLGQEHPGATLDDVDAALREAVEETGLDPAGVDVLVVLPELWVPPSGNAVTPVLAWWREPSHVAAVR